ARYEDAYLAKHGNTPPPLGRPAWVPAETLQALVAQGQQVGIERRKQQFGDDVTALQELILYGLKGTAAYADHAYLLGQEDDAVYAFFHETLDFLTRSSYSLDE